MEENGNESKNSERMVCSHCGCELPDGALLCPKCGKEIVQISPTDILEEEFLQDIVDEESHNGNPESGNETTSDAAFVAERSESDADSPKRNRKRSRYITIAIIIIAAVVAVIVFVFVYQNRSTNYLLRRATREYNQRDYDDALEYLDKLFAVDADNVDGLVLEGEVYTALGDYDAAESAFLSAIALDPDSVEAYEGLLKLYDMYGDNLKIIALKQGVTNEEILALFDDYLIPAPEILTEGGNYDDSFTVALKTNYRDAVIYYTLDGTTPTDTSTRYTEPIRISEEGTTVLTAVIMDPEGEYSEPVSETYVLEYPVPENPIPTPDGGQFTTETTIEVAVPDNAVVYYTWDNKTPTENSTLYTDPIPVPEGNNVLSLIAINEWGKESEVVRYNYIYYPQTTAQTIEDNDITTYSSESTGTINGVQPEVTTPDTSTTTEEPEPEVETEPDTTEPTVTEEPDSTVTEEPTTEPDTVIEEHDE